MATRGLRDFLEIPYDELEAMNLEAKQSRIKRAEPKKIADQRLKYLASEKKEEMEIVGKIFRRSVQDQPTEVVLMHMKGGLGTWQKQ